MTKFLAGLFALGLVLSPVKSANTDSASQSVPPSLSLASENTTQGGSLTISLVADGLNNISAFSCDVFYPVSVVETSAVYPSANEAISLYDIKNDEAGVVSFSFLSPEADGLSFADDTILLSITVGIKDDAPIGSTRFWCAVGEVFDSNKNPIALNSPSCYSTIAEKRVPVEETKIGLSCPDYNYVKDDDVALTFRFEKILSLSTFRIVFSFDYSVFDFISFNTKVDLASAQTTINTQQSGVVAWALLSPNELECQGEFATLNLKVKVDKETISTVNVSISQAYGENKTQYGGSNGSADVKICKVKPMIRLKNLSFQSNTMSLDCVVDANSGMACGDFTITYPADSFIVVSTKTTIPAKVILSKNKNDGSFNFSYLDTKDLVDETTLLTICFEKRNFYANLGGNIEIKNRYDNGGEPRNSSHEHLPIGFESCQYSFPFHFDSISYNVSWDSETRIVTDDYFGLYMNAGESIYNIKVNEIPVDSIKNELAELSENNDVYTATKPCAFVASFYQDQFSFGYCGWEDEIRSMRAEEFAKKLDRLTSGVTICDGNGFLPEKKSEMLGLLEEYRKFVDEIKNILSEFLLSDGTSVLDRIAVIERGEMRGTVGSLLPRKPGNDNTQNLSDAFPAVFAVTSFAAVLGFVLYHCRKRFE